MGFEESLIRNAAPTLAGIKVANLYNYQFSSAEECEESIRQFNQQLNEKGIYIELMKRKNNFYLLYVYRKSQLSKILNDRSIRAFLVNYGYDFENKCETSVCLNILKDRINEADCFPHEIGIFLGYPLEDVVEFISRKGEGCELCGEWKVYHNVQSAQKFFSKLKKCRDVYFQVYSNGRPLYRMTVSA